MNLSQLRWPMLIALLASLLAGGIMKLMLGSLVMKNPHVVMPREAWQAVQVPSMDASAIVAELGDRNFWGLPPKSAVAASEPLTRPAWRIMAVIKQGGSERVIIAFENDLNKPIELKVGDKLPGGYPIVAIQPEYIMIRINGRVRALSAMR